MAVRTAYAPVSGEVLTAANLAKLAGGWIGDAQVTANQGSITTVADLTGLTVSVTVGTGRKIKITAQAWFSSTVSNDVVSLTIAEGGTNLSGGQLLLGSTGGNTYSIGAVTALTPTSGAHTYKLTATRAAGTGTITMNASTSFPAIILVEDIGPSS